MTKLEKELEKLQVQARYIDRAFLVAQEATESINDCYNEYLVKCRPSQADDARKKFAEASLGMDEAAKRLCDASYELTIDAAIIRRQIKEEEEKANEK